MKLQRPDKTQFFSRPRIGTWITIPHPSVAEILVRAGFDWLCVDLEHSAVGLESCAELVRVADLAGAMAFVRVGTHDPNLLKRVMDAGTHGVIVSTVNTPEQAEAVVSAVKYPPLGRRGVGLSRAQGYNDEFEDHYTWVNEQSIVIVQIEHIEAVRHLEGILRTPGVDGFFIGPYDLSASMGIPGDFRHPEFVTALAEIARVREAVPRVVAGCHVVETCPQEARQRLTEGWQFLAYGIDFLFLKNKAREGLAEILSAAG